MIKNLYQKFRQQDSSFAFLVFLLFFLILAIGSPYFFLRNNILSLQGVIAPRVIMAIGMMLVVILGMFDLSVGSVMGLGGILCGYMLSQGFPVFPSVVCSVLIGGLIGALNGVLVAIFNIIPLIATIGTMYIFRGFCEMIMTSNVAQEAYDRLGYARTLQKYKANLDGRVGPTKIFVSGNTLQVSDYTPFDWTMFDAEAKKARRETVFPQERQKCFELGAGLVRG